MGSPQSGIGRAGFPFGTSQLVPQVSMFLLTKWAMGQFYHTGQCVAQGPPCAGHTCMGAEDLIYSQMTSLLRGQGVLRIQFIMRPWPPPDDSSGVATRGSSDRLSRSAPPGI